MGLRRMESASLLRDNDPVQFGVFRRGTFILLRERKTKTWEMARGPKNGAGVPSMTRGTARDVPLLQKFCFGASVLPGPITRTEVEN